MKRKVKKVKVRKNAKLILICGFISVLVITLVLTGVLKTVNEIIDKYKEANDLENKMAQLQETEDNLNSEILKLQDKDYLARYAREKYFYSKNGELIIRIPTTDEK